ncbi:hypothetical protein BH11CYA1_BH11CYA1_14660 [soil metagenome]
MKKKDAVILLAEDEETLQYVFASQIKALGYRSPEFASNGLEAVKVALQKRVHIIFMDIRMPVLDGISATVRIREQEAGAQIPIIGLSAYSQKPACMAAGMNDYMQKPVMLYQIDEMITKHLNISKSSETTTLLNEPLKVVIDQDKYAFADEKLKALREKIDELRKHTDIP